MSRMRCIPTSDSSSIARTSVDPAVPAAKRSRSTPKLTVTKAAGLFTS